MIDSSMRAARAAFGAAVLALTALISTGMIAGPAFAQTGERYAAIVLDAGTQEVLHEEMADERRYPASLTKMMTLYMLFDALEKGEVRLSERMPVSRFASQQPPSKLGLRRGETIRVEDAIRGLVTKSANDAAVVVAERLGGTEARFAARMTARARDLGMTSTRFINASGLPHRAQTTTARDMARLSQALLRDFPQYYAYFRTPGMTWRSRFNRNHNRLLGQVQGMDGIKTGYTRASGFNLASSVERGASRIVAVVLGGETASARDNQMAYLIENAFEQIGVRTGAALVSMPSEGLAAALAGPSEEEMDETAAEDGSSAGDGAAGGAAPDAGPAREF